MNCYFCGEDMKTIVDHMPLYLDIYTCPKHIKDKTKHLQPHINTSAEKAIDSAWERNR